MRLYAILISAFVFVGEATAGFITIDTFTDSMQSDGVGDRSFIGDVKVANDNASMIGGVAWLGEVASITYDFLPSPLVVKPKFVLILRNNQTNYTESGIIRATINGGPSFERELFAVRDYETIVFDFIPLVPIGELINQFRVDWFRPDQATGARELLIDSIAVSDVPEPSTLGLLFVTSLMVFSRYCKRILRWQVKYV